MTDGLKLKKILWSLDAFEDKEEIQIKAARILGIFQNKTFAEIEPVFVLGSTEVNGVADYSTEWMKEFQDNLRGHLEEVLLARDFPWVLAPKILVEPLASTAASVENLLQYASRENADLIIVSSHSRRGLDRFFLGSFAETLLVHSTVPVLVVGAHTKAENNLSRILFPTEFGEFSHQTFRRTISVAKQMGALVMIYHVVPMPARIVMDSGYYPSLYGIEGEMVSLEDFLKIQTDRQTRRAESWAQWAKTEGVECTFKVETANEAIDESICKQAESENCDLILMEGQSGPVKVALLGSIARNVVRMAPCPVLVFPRATLRAEEKATERVPVEAESQGISTAEFRDFEI